MSVSPALDTAIASVLLRAEMCGSQGYYGQFVTGKRSSRGVCAAHQLIQVVLPGLGVSEVAQGRLWAVKCHADSGLPWSCRKIVANAKAQRRERRGEAGPKQAATGDTVFALLDTVGKLRHQEDGMRMAGPQEQATPAAEDWGASIRKTRKPQLRPKSPDLKALASQQVNLSWGLPSQPCAPGSWLRNSRQPRGNVHNVSQKFALLSMLCLPAGPRLGRTAALMASPHGLRPQRRLQSSVTIMLFTPAVAFLQDMLDAAAAKVTRLQGMSKRHSHASKAIQQQLAEAQQQLSALRSQHKGHQKQVLAAETQKRWMKF